ncbi:MAG: hypothetical protein HFF01_05430 [Erysipelotrichaceae bacterium]|nr:hypothetical protein [Erysipelotrichaceae bacterium]
MEKVVIFGISNFSALMRRYLNKYSKSEIVGYTVDKKYIDTPYFDGLTVYPFEDIEQVFSPDEHRILLTIGYNNMNDTREMIYHACKAKGYTFINFIHPTAIIDCDEMGDANILLENVILAPGSKIGSGNICFGNVHIAHGAQLGNYNFLSCNVLLGGEAIVSDHCFLGLGAIVGSARVLAPYTFLGMETSINNNTKPNEVYVKERAVKLDKDSKQMMKYLGRLS